MKNLILYTCIALTIIACICLIRCNENRAKNQQVPTTFVVKPPTQYTDEGGTVHTEATVDVAGINAYYQEVIDSLVKVIKAKPKVKAVQDIALVGTETNGNFKPKIDTVYLDTNHYESPTYILNYKDKWLKLKGYVNIDSPWHYQVIDSIGLVTYWRRKHWYSNKELYVDGFSFNPNTHLTGLTAIKLNAAQPKKWGVGFTVGYGVGKDFTLQPFVGVGIQRNLIRF